jgi:hypothetical protein
VNFNQHIVGFDSGNRSFFDDKVSVRPGLRIPSTIRSDETINADAVTNLRVEVLTRGGRECHGNLAMNWV